MAEGKHRAIEHSSEDDNFDEELIDLFFSNRLSQSQLKLFDEKVKTNSEFAKKIALQQSLRRSANLPNSEFRAKVFQNAKAKRIRNWQLLATAAGILALLTLSWFYYSTPQEPIKLRSEDIASTRGITPIKDNRNPQVYFDNIQIPLPSLASLSTQTKNIHEDLKSFLIPYKETSFFTKPSSLNLYQNGSYQPFLQNCSEDLQRLKNSDLYKMLVLKGSAQLFTGEFKNANKTLQSVLNNPQAESIHDTASYYLAITQLYLGQFASAKSNLDKIQNQPYSIKAKFLLMLLVEKEY